LTIRQKKDGDIPLCPHLNEDCEIILNEHKSKEKFSDAFTAIIGSLILAAITCLITLEFKRASEKGQFNEWKRNVDEKVIENQKVFHSKLNELMSKADFEREKKLIHFEFKQSSDLSLIETKAIEARIRIIEADIQIVKEGLRKLSN
jgi:hypothetical protein